MCAVRATRLANMMPSFGAPHARRTTKRLRELKAAAAAPDSATPVAGLGVCADSAAT